MIINFSKYHGTGNDFIIINDPQDTIILDTNQIKFLCDRKFGIGADGLMLLKSSENQDFAMKYYNSDGYIGTMCGNGGRCITAFAKNNNVIHNNNTIFMAADGLHQSYIDDKGLIKLKMIDVDNISDCVDYLFMDTGSPHYVEFVENAENIDVYNQGRKIRYSKKFENGTNVNFVSKNREGIYVRTYERGVEDETLSCGTGSVASAIAFYYKYKPDTTTIAVKTKGGNLEVSFDENDNKFTNVHLKGPAEFVFSGTIDC